MAELPNSPDYNVWSQRKTMVEAYQAAWRGDVTLDEDMYELRWKMDGIPDNVPITLPSTARAVIDEATDHNDFDPSWLRVMTPTYGLTQEAERRSSTIRAWVLGWLSYQVTKANDVSPIRDFVKNLHLYGKAVYKVVYDREAWPELEVPEGTSKDNARKLKEKVEKDREFVMPVVMRSIQPTALYEDPTVGEKKWAIEVYEYRAMEIIGQYMDSFEQSEYEYLMENPDRTCELWDCYQVGEQDGVRGLYHLVVGHFGEDEAGEAITKELSDNAFLPNEPFPYIVRFSGFGRQSSGKYEEKARGLLFAARSLLQAEARRLTQLDSIISAMAWPTLFVNGPRTKFRVEYGPNKVNYIPSGVKVDTVTPPLPVGPLQAALATIQSGIERGTFGSVIRGDKPPQTTSAAQLAILSGQARLRFGSIRVAHESALVEAFQKAAYIVKDVIGAPVVLWQVNDTDEEDPAKLTLSPDEVPFPFVCQVAIKADPAEEREREAQLAVFLHEKGIIDWEEAAERAGVVDVAAMRRRMIRDLILFKSPAVLQALGEQYVLESGYDIESLTLEKAARDMMILRSQQQMQQALMGGQPNQQGSEPKTGFSPNQLGGRPPETTPQSAEGNAMASLAGG